MRRFLTREVGHALAKSHAGGHSFHADAQGGMSMIESIAARGLATLAAVFALSGCGSAGDGAMLFEPWIAGPGPRQPAWLAFSNLYDGRGEVPVGAPNFPKLLSQTGAFADVGSL